MLCSTFSIVPNRSDVPYCYVTAPFISAIFFPPNVKELRNGQKIASPRETDTGANSFNEIGLITKSYLGSEHPY